MALSEYEEMVWLDAVIKEASERRDLLKGRCKDELLEQYEADGTTQKRSKLFGKDASVLSVVFSKPKAPREVVEFNLADWDGFSEWLEANPKAAADYAFAKAEDFGEWWLRKTGELPDGVARVTHMTDPEPERVTGVRLSVKPEKVFEALGISFEEGIRGMLPGDAV